MHVDPPEKSGGADAEASWWVVDRLVGSDVERALDELVPRWLVEHGIAPSRGNGPWFAPVGST